VLSQQDPLSSNGHRRIFNAQASQIIGSDGQQGLSEPD
jgi:hypothetical protein